MSGTLALLIALVIGIEIAIPIGTYLLFKGRYDEKTRLWFISVLCNSAAIILVALRPLIPEYVSHQVSWMLMIAAFQLMLEAISRELHPRTRWRVHAAAFLSWVCLINVIYLYGLTESLGFAAYSIALASVSGILLMMLWKLNKHRSSTSLRILQIAFFLYGVPALLRVVAYVQTGSVDQLNVFKFSMVTNILVFAWVLGQMFLPFGYWGFTLEKAESEREQAEAGEDRATQEADRFRLLVEERDRLLVMNSRFSVVSALSSFSAMLIHDITQPLQTLQLGLERIRSDLVKGAPRERLEVDVEQLEKTMDRAGNLVSGLRTLMQSGESKVAPVLVAPLFDKIDSILSSEALNRKVAVVRENNLPHDCQIMADEVMLQRVMINLISNALNQFRLNPVSSPQVTIRLEQEDLNDLPGVVIQVTDNGGGFPLELLERVGQPWSSSQPEGLGMALMLSKQLVGLWGGYLKLFNRSDGVAGAGVRIWLRKAEKTDKTESPVVGIPKNGNTVF